MRCGPQTGPPPPSQSPGLIRPSAVAPTHPLSGVTLLWFSGSLCSPPPLQTQDPFVKGGLEEPDQAQDSKDQSSQSAALESYPIQDAESGSGLIPQPDPNHKANQIRNLDAAPDYNQKTVTPLIRIRIGKKVQLKSEKNIQVLEFCW